ncbi:hypothetical protein CDD81_7755 [Ophiocordyceps australis]|uniref:Uncharacterized protein n=1 Tax=Ophiocordyceps australis TaxID=1399860 RepID=A0A2C5Y4U0_9HYPO|nr:hypothetical protein CDD81_7755 [Ophiocordyceps australis]
MAVLDFSPVVPPSSVPHSYPVKSRYTHAVRSFFQNSAAVVTAAVAQLAVCLALPSNFAIVPPAVLLLCWGVSSLVHHAAPAAVPNPYKEHVVPHRASAQLPLGQTDADHGSEKADRGGVFGGKPGSGGIVVFNLGGQFNHPLGPRAPGAAAVQDFFVQMVADLASRRDELGLLSMAHWHGSSTEGTTSINTTFYFRDVESIHRFAHEELHRTAWDYYYKNKYPHLGIFHETFIVQPGSWETIYENCSPVGLGNGSVRLPDLDDDGQPRWVSTLVAADNPSLKTQKARLGRQAETDFKWW